MEILLLSAVARLQALRQRNPYQPFKILSEVQRYHLWLLTQIMVLVQIVQEAHVLGVTRVYIRQVPSIVKCQYLEAPLQH